MSTIDDQLKLVLMQALGEPVGLLLRTNDRDRLRQALYRVRAKLADPALARLQFRVSPFDDGDLVICKGTEAPARPSAPTLTQAGL